MSDSKRLVKNTVIYAIGDIFPRLLTFISFPILTRYLLPADYGVLNYVNTLIVFLTAVGFLGVNTYYLVHYYRCKTVEEQKKLLGNLFSFIILFNLVVLTILLFFGKSLFHWIGSKVDFYPYIVIGLLTNFFNLFSILPSALYRLLEKPLLLTFINVLDAIITLVITLILVIHYHYSALGALYAALVVNFAFCFIFLITTRKYIIWNLNFSQIKTVLKFSLPLVPGSLAYYVTSVSDRILIEKYLNLFDLGIYGTASSLALILNIISYGAYKAFEPYIFKTWGSENFLKSFESIRNSFILVLLVGSLFLSFYSKEFFEIMTNVKYHLAYYYVPIIIIGVYSSAVNMLYGTIITAKGKTKVNSLINVGGGIISILLNITLLAKFGLVTAAIVSSFSLTAMLITSILFSDIKLDHLRPVIGVAFTALSIYFFVYIIKIDSIIISVAVKLVAIGIVALILSKILTVNISNLTGGFKIKWNKA